MAREYSRTQRLGPLLKEEIARLLQREVKDARIGMVTITDVEVTSDLKQATVYIQAPGDESSKAEAIEGLASAAGFIRSRIGRELRIRRTPELRFVLDRTQERAARIHELLAEVAEPDEPPEGEDGS
ncbi:MAG: 30S ribosome-binding factor RbfA [Gemmatimonadota bacterium]|nr:MAG: 30S ribosome-binding factor RbfA [Gemmatimonadota bacterium]